MAPRGTVMNDYWIGKAAVVTGAARGQGASITILLAQAGARVYAMDRLEAADPAWRALRDACAASPGSLECLELDVADAPSWQKLAAQLQAEGQALYGLVNNAGITGPRNTVTRTVLDDWERVLQVNLTGAMLGIRALAPLMRANASIVNIASVAGMTGYYSAAYSTSKWALRGLSRSAALELAPAGIRVNCVCPGVVDTEMVRSNAALYQALQEITPMGHMADPSQIAEVLMFLLGPSSSYITGADIAVDGGVSGGGIFWPVGRAVGALAARTNRHPGKQENATGRDVGPGAEQYSHVTSST
jgi:3alpha(or 20beta)-hydroxysteroid dehydrogenase